MQRLEIAVWRCASINSVRTFCVANWAADPLPDTTALFDTIRQGQGLSQKRVPVDGSGAHATSPHRIFTQFRWSDVKNQL